MFSFQCPKQELPHCALFICHENIGGRCSQSCKSLGQAQYCLSAAKDEENKELHFEEIAKGKYERTHVCLTKKTTEST